MSEHPILIGMNNPLSTRPGYALYPEPPGCTGNRLYEMLRANIPSVTQTDYLRCFERTNLVIGAWDRRKAGVRAIEIRCSLMSAEKDRVVVLLGKDVQRAFRIEGAPMDPVRLGPVLYWCVPHPSGLNRWYNMPGNAAKVGVLLGNLYVNWRDL